MSGLRPWQLSVWQGNTGAPFFSLGIHVDLHTPTVDIHLPGWTVQVGRNGYWGVVGSMDGVTSHLGGRIIVARSLGPWNGHTDNCDHLR